MGSGNVAPAPVILTPWNPPLPDVPPPPHAAAKSTTAATAAVAAKYRLNLRMHPPSFLSWCRPPSPDPREGLRGEGGQREASNPLPGKPPHGRLLGPGALWTSHEPDARRGT